MRLIKIIFFLVTCTACPLRAEDKPGNTFIYVSQDQSNIINRISEYMKNKPSISTIKARDKKGRYLKCEIAGSNSTKTTFFIRVKPSKDKEKKISKILIIVEMYYNLPEKLLREPVQNKLLEFSNSTMQNYDFPQLVIVTSNGLLFRSFINIPSVNAPIPTEIIYSNLIISANNWTKILKELQKKFKMPEEKIITKLPEEKKAK